MNAKDYEWLQEEAEVEKYQPKLRRRNLGNNLKKKRH